MGNEESAPGTKIGKLDGFSDMGLSRKTENEFVQSKYLRRDSPKLDQVMDDDDLDDDDDLRSTDIAKMPYNGLWGKQEVKGESPCARLKHFTAHDEEGGVIYIGYGVSERNEYLNDVWGFNIKAQTWKQLKLTGKFYCPRGNACACMMGHYIVVFGGYDGNRYFNDLHTIDVQTGEVIGAPADNLPSPRMGAAIGIYERKLFIYGGRNGETTFSEYHVMSFENMSFKRYQTDYAPREDSPFIQYENKLMTFPYKQEKGAIAILDMRNDVLQLVHTIGTFPPKKLKNSTLLRAGDFLFFMGGENKWTYVYAMYLRTLFWFVFFTAPDEESVSPSDGHITKDGLFVLPRYHSISAYYDKVHRTVGMVLGYPMINPPPLNTLSVGDAFAICHIREDMKETLNLTRTS